MPKGMFTQGLCLLTDGRTSIADLRAAVEAKGFGVAREKAAEKLWCFSGPSLALPFLRIFGFDRNAGFRTPSLPRSSVEAIRDPSGDQTGSNSQQPVSALMFLTWDPSARMTYTSAWPSTPLVACAIHLPSGE